MAAQMQGQQPDTIQKRNDTQKSFLWKLALVLLIVVAALALLTVWILSILNVLPAFWANILYAIITVVGIVTPLIVLIITRNKPAPEVVAPPASLPPIPIVSPQPVVVQVHYPPQPSPLPVQPQASVPEGSSYRDIIAFPPPTSGKAIQQREQAVEEIYAQLSQPDITALALTGIGGAGKSTLAALVYEYAERQRSKGADIFQDTPLWLTVNESATMSDLAGTLNEASGKAVPDIEKLPPVQQAVALFNVLNAVDKPRLIILDQFENLLDWQTGHALAERPGVGEWLDALNSLPCACRILLTSRPQPRELAPIPPPVCRYTMSGK